MKATCSHCQNIIFAFILLLSTPPLIAEGLNVSGIIESNGYIQDDTDGDNSWMMEEFANLRMKTKIHDKAVIYGAVNASALSMNDQQLTTVSELERLYMSVRTEKADIDAGYMRIAFGYGQAFRPTDIFNPPNPLYPDARPKGALGSVVSIYPVDDYKFQIFGADRTNPYTQYSGQSHPLAGGSGEMHTPQFSTQALYALQTTEGNGLYHHTGFSVKFDAVVGVAIDSLYTYRRDDDSFFRGFECALGADYSFLDGDLYIIGQYFYNGDGTLDSEEDLSDLYGSEQWKETPADERIPITGFADLYRRHYFYLSATWSFDDYTRVTGANTIALEDRSFQPALTVEHEPFQGMTLSATVRAPVDSSSLGGSEKGELGPDNCGYYDSVKAGAKLRF